MSKDIIIEDGLCLYNKTGIGQYAQNLYDIFRSMGYEVEMKRKPFLEKIKNATIKRILYGLWINIIFPFTVLFKKADTIIFINTLTPLYKIPGKNYYPVIHDLWLYKSSRTATNAQKISMSFNLFSIKRTYKKIITVSNTVKREIIDFYKYPENDIAVIYNYFSFGENPQLIQSHDEQIDVLNRFKIESKKYILSVATLNKRKNIPMLIEAYKKLDTNIKLVLVGGKHSQKFDINDDNIIFTEYIDDETLKIMYKHSLIYAFPSFYEGFGIPIIDAQSFGIPVLCSNIPVFHEITQESAEFCDITIDDIFKELNILINDQTKLNQLEQKGYMNIKRFSKDTIKKQIEEALC